MRLVFIWIAINVRYFQRMDTVTYINIGGKWWDKSTFIANLKLL